MTSMPSMTQIMIAAGVGLVAAIAIRTYRAWSTRRRQKSTYVHDALMKRAQAYASESPFVAHLCRQYRANGRISDRQAKTVAKAIARLEAERSEPKRDG